MRLAFITPPPVKPSEPGISAAAAAELLGRLGLDCLMIDASIEWHRYVLAPERLRSSLERALAQGATAQEAQPWVAAVRSAAESPHALRRRATYHSRALYSSAVNHLEQALRLTARPFPAVRLGIAMFGLVGPSGRLESSAVLDELSARPGPFDDYYEHGLLPKLETERISHVAVSLSFQQQAPAAFRLARLLSERMPSVVRLLGGPLVACWAANAIGLRRPPFSLFHQVVPGSDQDLQGLAALLGAQPQEALDFAQAPRSVPLAVMPWSSYLSPEPVVPAALGRGCYWRACTFCPDHLHPRHCPCSPEGLQAFLRAVAARFPEGAMLHWTDSALPPALLGAMATVIRDERLPLRWHGFVRVQAELARPDFAQLLAAGGCALLQLGVETGSPRLLEMTGKGAPVELTRAVLETTAQAGIRNHVYLLFGLPTETDADRELTLALVQDQAGAICAINPALLNLPRGSPMHRHRERFGITELRAFGADTDLSLYDDFRCGASHPRTEARSWLAHRFFKSPAVRAIRQNLRDPFKANHLCFLG